MRFFMRARVLLPVLILASLPKLAPAETLTPQKIPVALTCWVLSEDKDKKRIPTFADKFAVDFSNGALSGERPTRVQKGRETYKGSVEPAGKIKLSGKGHYDDRSSDWTSEYAGQLQEKGPTNLFGTMRVGGKTPAVHKCAITFLAAPLDLAKILLSKESAAQPKSQ